MGHEEAQAWGDRRGLRRAAQSRGSNIRGWARSGLRSGSVGS